MSLELNPIRTALVLIDLQQGIMSLPLAPHAAADVLGRSLELGRACAAAGAAIVCVNVAFDPANVLRLKQPVDAPSPAGPMLPNWADLVPEIAALPNAIRITKRQWGAFHGTELDLQLRRRGITTIILGGIATNFGVESTAREAWQHGYAVVIAEDACTTVGAELHGLAIGKILPRIARVRPTAEILAALPPGQG